MESIFAGRPCAVRGWLHFMLTPREHLSFTLKLCKIRASPVYQVENESAIERGQEGTRHLRPHRN